MHPTLNIQGTNEKTVLIKRLQEANLSIRRFVKVDDTKSAFEKEWQNHLYTPNELQNYHSWGICGGDGLVLIDADNEKMADILRRILPSTFESLSSRRKLPHFYFKVINGEVQNKILYLPDTNEVSGEIRVNNQYLVAAGTKTYHGIYKIIADRPIAALRYEQFMDTIKPYFGKDSSQKITEEQILNGVSEGERHQIGIKLANKYSAEFDCDYGTVLHEMQRWNEKCKPPNDDEEIKQMVQDAIAYQKRKTNPEPTTNREAKYKQRSEKIEPDMGFALQLLNNYSYKCSIDTEKLLVFNEGIYESAKKLVHQLLETEYRECLSRHFVDEAYSHLQRANYIDRSQINKFTNKIPIQNGLFNILTREIEPFDQEQVFTYKLDVSFDPEAKCPNWLNFVKEVVSEDDIPLLQEIMGYCLLPAMPFHKLFWLYGTGRNGKGVVIRTIEAVLGKDNVSNLNLSEFTEGRRFSLQRLYGKLFNVSSEPRLSKYGLQTTVLKMATGEDTIDAELKGKNSRLKFVNYAKLIVLGNHFPRVQDSSLGWWDRVVVLNFPNSFEAEKGIPNIENRWIPEELPGIFNWMQQGLYRIKESNGFSSSKSTEDTKTEFMKVSDPFNAWILEKCEKNPDVFIINEEAFTAYLDYCDEIGTDRDGKRSFYEKLRQEPQVKEKQKMVAEKNRRVFYGITLKTDEKKQTNLACLASLAVSHTQQVFESKNERVEKPAKAAKTANVECVLGDGKVPLCFNCKKSIFDPIQLTNFDGQFYCRTCRDNILSQRKKEQN